ncbi:MAG TPA: glycoside hydrolase family 3 C-terminal domain-containing protein, partial [Polyangiaceae bacterium]
LDDQARSLVSQMTPEEKLSLLAGQGKLERGLWVTNGVSRLGLSGYRMSDGARGLGATQFVPDSPQKGTAFPVGMARGASFDADLEERVGEAIGQETRAWGGNVILAPVVNVLRHPGWGRAQETYGEDPWHLGVLGAAFVRGAQKHVIANAKHFAVNDIEDTRFTVNVTVDERTLREVFLQPFQATVKAGVGSVMSAYNQVNGDYCSQSAHLLNDILKGEWGFRGLVMSDWVAAVRSTAPSVNAGLDLEMPAPNYFSAERLQAALDAGEITDGVVAQAVFRLVRGELELGDRVTDAAPPIESVGSAEHAALALEVAQKSMVLLKNAGNALPLVRAETKAIAVVGTLAGVARLGDEGSSKVVPGHAVTPLAGILSRAGSVTVNAIDSDTLAKADEAVVAAADAAVVVVGLTATDEGENTNGTAGDRKTLGLSAAHEALILAVAAKNPRTIVVIEAGSAITMEAWKTKAKGIIHAFYPGQEGGNAIADVLFGDVNPSGKLPFTIPVSESQLPPFDVTSAAVTYGYFHGYRYVDHDGSEPAFPFGFGLSYTTFDVSNLTLSQATIAAGGRVSASVDVKNTGAVAGDEVVELYVGYPGSTVDNRPEKELKGFSRVHLDAGQSKTVTLPLDANDLRDYDARLGAWLLEPLAYTVYAGDSSRNLPLVQTLTVH